ncbi:Uu.00g083820.m01.CDS01 [Anthostomella pinea]|uniref:20S-pre-rRNA D-site endonuclease NOB1 n=1 Tax=Anthostomella pinea TaxID=933095 RepID=A0AAI8VMK0_9PEZI|nr:Uu.00g083820.m01.CDS01 [Anthostomella pinea]
MATTEDHRAPEARETAPTVTEVPEAPEPTASKAIHSLVLDAGPLIKNDPPVSTLLAQAVELYTLPSVISEIRDAATRTRVETTLLPFLKQRSPKPESVKFATDFARRTGDLEVLSRPDLHLIALTYELECERNGGDWRLRKTPGQKGLNGKSPAAQEKEPASQDDATTTTTENVHSVEDAKSVAAPSSAEDEPDKATEDGLSETPVSASAEEPAEKPWEQVGPTIAQETVSQTLDSLSLEPSALPIADFTPDDLATAETKAHVVEEDDDEGWITPANLKQHQARDQLSAPDQPIQRFLQVALLTSDYAMQNVLLRMNLNLVSPNMARITRVKTWVLRCHGCFQITRDMSKQFCPKCGQPTLTRVSCSTDQNGNFAIHLKKNFQWNNRGNVYSVPKPVHGTSNGKMRGPGGGQNGWGRDLIFAEDQKEYVKKSTDDKRMKTRDLMDEDYLPSILTGNRQSGPGRIRVGAGRNVNSRKKH